MFEIISEHDKANSLQGKLAEYLEHGAAEVWVIYPKLRDAWVHCGSTQEAIRETRAIHSDLLPGVEIPFDQFI